MGGSGGRSDAGAFELDPLVRDQIQSVGVAGDDVLASVSSRSSEQNHFRLRNLCDGVPKACERHFAKHFNFLHIYFEFFKTYFE